LTPGARAHQTRRSGRLLRLGFNEIVQFLSKSEVLDALKVFSNLHFFSPIIILFLQYSHKRSSMFLKFYPYRIWCSIFYSKLVNCILFKIIVQHVCLWKVEEHAVVGKETLKFGSIFGSLPAFPSLRPKVKSPCFYYVWWALPGAFRWIFWHGRFVSVQVQVTFHI
jgi:hypothetical protein